MTLLPRRLAAGLAFAVLLFVGGAAVAVDWPMWRFDASRTASSPEELPLELHLQWTLELPPPESCWPWTQYKLQFDKSYEPIVVGDLLFVPSMTSDCVVAYHAETGEEAWRFYAGGPVRFAPTAWEGKLYFVSDDSYLYCLDATAGKLLWKFRGAPSERRLLGNARFISAWPARGAPVVYDGTVYFAASIWPFMGTFFYAVDAETGKVVWSNSGSGQDYMLQPHSSPAFAGVAPQGYLVATDDKLLVPGGRSVPAAYDRKTGSFLYHRAVTKSGGYAVYHRGEIFLNDGYVYKTSDGGRLARSAATVFAPGAMIGIPGDGVVRARSPQARWRETVDTKGRKQKVADFPVVWESRTDPRFERAYIRAGSRLYCGAPGLVGAVDLPALPGAQPDPEETSADRPDFEEPAALIARSAESSDFSLHPALLLGRPAAGKAKPAPTSSPSLRVSWQSDIEGKPWTMLAANGRLFVVTEAGRIHCFGPEQTTPTTPRGATTDPASNWTSAAKAKRILDATGVREGYCLVLGVDSGDVVEELVRQSRLYVVGLCRDAAKLGALRRRLDDAGLYGRRAALCHGDLGALPLPPYFASLVTCEDLAQTTYGREAGFLPRLYEVLRPYGGVACLKLARAERTKLMARVDALSLPSSAAKASAEFALLERSGALPGAAPWTHQYGDVANSVCSKDTLARSPLGMLWFGGPGHEDVLPRHGHGPTQQVIGGRLFIEGIHVFSARDVYTGRTLWRKELPNLNTYDMYYNVTYKPDVYDRSYNQVHIPGANQYGSNFVAAPDKLYIAQGAGTLLTVGDLLDPTSLLVKLREADDPVSAYLRGQLSESVLKAVTDYNAALPPTAALQNTVVGDLNRLLQLGSLYDEERFGDVALPESLRRRALAPVEGQRKVLLNRALLQASYPNEIAPALPRPVCLVLDPATGDTLQELHLPDKPGLGTPNWGYLGVYEDLLIAGAVPFHLAKSGDGATLDLNNRFAVGSKYLVVIDRNTGEVLWEREAAYNFRHNAIAAGEGKVFCLDGLSKTRMALLERRGEVPESKPQVLALDARTGEELWSAEPKSSATWLSYSEEHGIVVLGGSAAGDRARDEQRMGMSAYQARDGALLWHHDDSYAGPPILWHNRIITQTGGGNTSAPPAKAYNLLTGKRVTTIHPLTGETIPWEWLRFKGCNTAVASEHLLTFRSASGCYADLPAGHSTTSIGGFKSGCTSNLVVADGVLNAPDYTRTCTCSYQNQTSFALVHMPDALADDLGLESWSFDHLPSPDKPVPVKRIGLNFGAPGNRLAANGTLWIEVPSVGGPSPDIPVAVSGDSPKFFRRHMSQMEKPTPEALNWVAASGIEGLTGVTVRLVAQPGDPKMNSTVRGYERNHTTVKLPTSLGESTAPNETPMLYTVRLHFAEPGDAKPGERVFGLSLNGKRVTQDLDITMEAGGPNRAWVREFSGIPVIDDLQIDLTPSPSRSARQPLLCGVEIIAEES